MKADFVTRRKLVVSGSLAGIGAAAVHTRIALGKTGSDAADLYGPHLDVRTAKGSLQAFVKVAANLDLSRKRYDWFEGQVIAVAPNGNVVPFAGIRGVFETQLTANGEHGWRRHRRLIAGYSDIETDKVMAELHNPFTGERVSVSHISNAISEDTLEESSFVKWRQSGANFDLQNSVQVSFASASGVEALTGLAITSHVGAIADLQDPCLSMISDTGTWTLITGWLPWMNLGHAPGQCVFQCRRGGGADAIAEIPSRILSDIAPLLNV